MEGEEEEQCQNIDALGENQDKLRRENPQSPHIHIDGNVIVEVRLR